MMAQKTLDLKEIGERILLGFATTETFYGWEFRKGKTNEDINKAVRKARNPKHSFGKVEYEISMLEVYLKDVLKRKKGKAFQQPDAVHQLVK